MVQMMTQLLLGLWVVQLVDGACTCPPAAASCSLQDLVSSTGQDDCAVGADGVLAASISIRDVSQLAAIDFSGLVRTSGELRISNFLLWQIAYSEIWVTDTLWPDFRKRHFLQALVDYQRRDRRYGGVDDPAAVVRS